MPTINASKFFSEYEQQLKIAIQKYPEEYAWGFLKPEDTHKVADLMKAAFIKQSYNKDGRAVRAVCKVLGIRHTYADINDYLERP